jgi:integrase
MNGWVRTSSAIGSLPVFSTMEICFHDLQHTSATLMSEDGYTPKLLANAWGIAVLNMQEEAA